MNPTNGIFVELALDGSGVTVEVDEDVDEFGKWLTLPPLPELHRAEIEMKFQTLSDT